MSKDTINVNMNIYDIPIVMEQLNKLEQETKQLKEKYNIRSKAYNKVLLENADLKQENQMLKLTVEKLTKTPYEYSVRGN